MITTKLAQRGPRSTGDTPRTPGNGRHRRAGLPKYFRTLAAGATIAAAVTTALPGSAAADPSLPFEQGIPGQAFQIPSVITGGCAAGLSPFGFTLSNADFLDVAEFSVPGKSTFKFDVVAPGSNPAQVEGDVTFGWFNLTTFRSGIASGPFVAFDFHSTARASADTGSGQIVAFAQPRGTATPRFTPGPAAPCGFTPSIGVVSVR